MRPLLPPALESELIEFRERHPKIGEPRHHIERADQAGQAQDDEEEKPVFRVSRHGWPDLSLLSDETPKASDRVAAKTMERRRNSR